MRECWFFSSLYSKALDIRSSGNILCFTLFHHQNDQDAKENQIGFSLEQHYLIISGFCLVSNCYRLETLLHHRGLNQESEKIFAELVHNISFC